MTGMEIMKELREMRDERFQFIKWWRKENDFCDFQLLEDFKKNVTQEHEFAGYELLTTEEMWTELKSLVPEHVSKDKSWGKEVIRWQRPQKEARVCPFTASSIMDIFDVETRGDVLDH